MRSSSSFVLLVTTFVCAVSSLCYFPDGESIPRQDTPCRSSGFATCCGQGYACLSNNLCMLTEHVPNPIPGQSIYVRGSCTDGSWNSPNCPNFCVVPAHDDNFSGGTGVAKCDVTQDRYYCLDNQTEPLASSDICSSSTYFFEVAGLPSTVTIIGVAQTTSTVAKATPEVLSTATPSTYTDTSPTASVQQQSSSPKASRNLSTDPSAFPTSIATSPPNTATPDPSAISGASEGSGGKDYSIPIGLGVGIPLGVLAIGIIAFLAFRHRRHRRNAAAPPPQYAEPDQTFYQTKSESTGNWGSSRQDQPTVYHEAEWVQLVPQELPAG